MVVLQFVKKVATESYLTAPKNLLWSINPFTDSGQEFGGLLKHAHQSFEYVLVIKVSLDLRSQCLKETTYLKDTVVNPGKSRFPRRRGSDMFPFMVTPWLLEISIEHWGPSLLSCLLP